MVRWYPGCDGKEGRKDGGRERGREGGRKREMLKSMVVNRDSINKRARLTKKGGREGGRAGVRPAYVPR